MAAPHVGTNAGTSNPANPDIAADPGTDIVVSTGPVTDSHAGSNFGSVFGISNPDIAAAPDTDIVVSTGPATDSSTASHLHGVFGISFGTNSGTISDNDAVLDTDIIVSTEPVTDPIEKALEDAESQVQASPSHA